MKLGFVIQQTSQFSVFPHLNLQTVIGMERKSFSSLDSFTRQYVATALWSSNDESDPSGREPLDRNYDHHDINDETLAAMVADCERFQRANAADLALAVGAYPNRNDDTGPEGTAGHDFWLTRNHHGCGYWDGDLPEKLGDRLTEAAHGFGEVNLFVGDDGKI